MSRQERGTDGQRSAVSRQRDAPAVLAEVLGLAEADLLEQGAVFSALHWSLEDGIEPAMEAPGSFPSTQPIGKASAGVL